VQDLIAYTTSELETLCALIMDTITERQGDVVPDSMEAFSKGLVCPHCGSIRCPPWRCFSGTFPAFSLLNQ